MVVLLDIRWIVRHFVLIFTAFVAINFCHEVMLPIYERCPILCPLVAPEGQEDGWTGRISYFE